VATAAEFHESIGVDRIEARVLQLAGALKESSPLRSATVGSLA